MVELERRGIPTVFFTAKTFVHDAQRSAASFGLPGLPIAVLPMPVTNQRPGAVHAMVDGAIEQVVAGLTRPVETVIDGHDLPVAVAETDVREATVDAVVVAAVGGVIAPAVTPPAAVPPAGRSTTGTRTRP